MKKYLLTLMLIAPMAFAAQQDSPQQELSGRLAKVDAFTAGFNQVVTSPEGELVSEGEGELTIQRPNLFNWTTTMPDENVLISDGETLWYYSPFIEQVTAMWLDDATAQTPFVLLTRNNQQDWQQYNVSQQGDRFTLVPITASTLGKFVVDVKPDGHVTGFTIFEQNGQNSRFSLQGFKATNPDKKLFAFNLPEGFELDDQRQ